MTMHAPLKSKHDQQPPQRAALIGVDFACAHRPSTSSLNLAGRRPMRLRLIGILALGWVGLLVGRLYSLQVSNFEIWQDWAIRQHVAEVEVASERGQVLDRNGKLLAVSVPAESIYVRPRQIKDRPRVVRELAKHLEIKQSQVAERINTKQPFVWIKRQVPRYQAEKVSDLNLLGVGTVLEARRFYPYNQAASALIGKVGIDGTGLSGIESLYEKKLHENHVKTTATRDAFGKIIHISKLDVNELGTNESDTADGFAPPKARR